MSSTTFEDEADDLARGVRDKAQAASAKAHSKIDDAASLVSDTAFKASAQAKDLYGQVSERAHSVAEQVDPYVKHRPYAAMGVVAAVGLVAGLLMAGRGPKVIYVKPRD